MVIEEQPAPGEKLQRGIAKGVFTRARNHLIDQVGKEFGEEKLTKNCEAMEQALKILDEANNSYLIAARIDLEGKQDHEQAAYLDECNEE